jgi:hypothetical protein
MNFKKILFLFFFTAICRGQTNELIIKYVNGATKSFKLSEIREVVFQGEPTDVKEKELIQNVLHSFTLYQNFPNPFNPSTNIQYLLPSAGVAEINIYDVQGRLVKALLNSQQIEGKHSVLWNGQNESGIQVPTGIYFCRVSFNNEHLTNKLVMIK